jgi:hypothetical protein
LDRNVIPNAAILTRASATHESREEFERGIRRCGMGACLIKLTSTVQQTSSCKAASQRQHEEVSRRYRSERHFSRQPTRPLRALSRLLVRTMKTCSELLEDYLASEARYKELVQRTVSAELNRSEHSSELAEIEEQRQSVLRESSRIFARLQFESAKSSYESLLKQIQYAEREIEAIETKIANCDDSETSPAEYAQMRSEQERNRQCILKCRAEMLDIKRYD